MSALRAVFWAFLGIRKGCDLDADAVRLSPVRVVVAGVAGAAMLVLVLLGLALWMAR